MDAKTPFHDITSSPSPEVEIGSVQKVQKYDIHADPAFAFTGPDPIEYTEAEERALIRKIDLHILPLLCWVYMIQFADKTSLNYASLMGIKTTNHLNPNSQQFAWVGSIFYAGYIFWEFPTTYLLRRLPMGKYTSIMIFFWGLVLTLTVACRSWTGLMIDRFFLGALESTVTPAFVLFTSIWYKKNEQATRACIWLACNGITTMIMSPFAYGLSGVTHAAIPTFEILFLILGLLTMVTGLFYIWYMPNSQIDAKFLTHREKLIAIERLRGNMQGIGNRYWDWSQFREAFRDPRTYLYVLFSLLMNIPNGGITTFGSIIINSFGFGTRLSLLLNLPGGAVDIVTKIGLGILSDRLLDRTFPAMIAICLPMIGGIIMITVPLHYKGGLLFGYYLISCAGCGWGLVMVLISNNTLGFTKKTTVNGLQILAYAAGNWIGPQTFRSWDAPHYYHGKLMVAIMYGLAACVLVALRFVNIWENKRRDKAQGVHIAAASIPLEDPHMGAQEEKSEFMDLTDFQQPKFRYIY